VSSVGSGCVSGLYLVESSDFGCTDNPLDTTNPQCRSIDLMQANLYGFETKPHPCSNGTCDAVSQCILSVRDSLTNSGYGPGGATIDTNKQFNVNNEFIATRDYTTFWKLRTTLTQEGRKITLESDCQDYLVALNERIEGRMGIVAASWDNSAGGQDFEQ